MSHLPLLFAEGQPTCLERITQAQLEKFIPFMVHCCPSSKTTVPSWWPRDLPFTFPLKPPLQMKKNWLWTMKNIVKQCYQHYDCVYVLEFCRKLASLGNKQLYYRETGDRTEVIERNTNRLLVSVKSKNKTYDMVPPSPKKLLLRPLPSKPPPIIDDIYLCNYCDEEFTSSRDIEEHERTEHPPQVEEQVSPQERYLRFLGLVPETAGVSNEGKCAVKARRITSNLNLKKISSTPICSPLGNLLLANTLKFTRDEAERSRVKLEQHCSTVDVVAMVSDTNGVRRSRRVPGLSTSRTKHIWSHQYCFNKQQKAERMKTIRTGLDRESRRLLRLCKSAKTALRKLPPLPGNLRTVNLRKMKEFIAEEFPNQTVLEPPKPVLPPTPVLARPPTLTPAPPRWMSLQTAIPAAMYAAFNNRPPLAGVPSNRLPTLVDANRNPLKVQKVTSPLQSKQVAPVPSPAPSGEPEIIDLCSSDDECEIVATPEEPERYHPILTAPLYGVTATCPRGPFVQGNQTEMAGIPAKDNNTVLYVQPFVRSRS